MEEDKNEVTENTNEKVSSYITRAREAAGISKTELAREIKITEEVLDDLETGDFEKLPVEAYVRGYLNSISRRLNLDNDKVLEMFNREYSSTYNDPQFTLYERIIDNGLSPKNNQTSSKTVIIIVVILILVFASFIKFSNMSGKVKNDDNKVIAEINSSSSLMATNSSADSIVANTSSDSQVSSSSSVILKKEKKVEPKVEKKNDVKKSSKKTLLTFKSLADSSRIKLFRHGPNRKTWTRYFDKTDEFKNVSWNDTISVWLDQPKNWELRVNSKKVTPKSTMLLLNGKVIK